MSNKNDKLDKLEHDVQNHLDSKNYSAEDKEIVQDLKLIREASRANVLDEKKKLLQQFETGKTEKNTTIFNYRRVIIPLSIAASLFIIAMFIFNKNQAVPNNQASLFEEYHEVYENLLTDRSENNPQASEKEVYLSKLQNDAGLYYDQGNYVEAANSFNQLYLESGKSIHNFYAALSNLLNENTAKAINQLEQIKGKADTQNLPVNYYLGLAYLKKNDLENAKMAFGNPDPALKYYQEKSAEILERIDK